MVDPIQTRSTPQGATKKEMQELHLVDGSNDAIVHDAAEGKPIRLSELTSKKKVVVVLFRHCL